MGIGVILRQFKPDLSNVFEFAELHTTNDDIYKAPPQAAPMLSSTHMDQHILDEPEKPKSDRVWAIIGWIALMMMALELLLRGALGWGGGWLIGTSALLMIIRFFGLRSYSNFGTAGKVYFAGHITLSVIVILQLAHIAQGEPLIQWAKWLYFIPGLLYLAGMIAAGRKKEEPSPNDRQD